MFSRRSPRRVITLLVSEYPGQPAPIVATAWGKQLYLQSVHDPELQQFVDFFQKAPKRRSAA